MVNYNLACTLSEYGHCIQVICQAINEPHSVMDKGVLVHRVGTDPRRYSAIARINYYFHAWKKLREMSKQTRFDVIHADHWSAEGLFSALFQNESLVVASYSTPEDSISAGNYVGFMQLWQLKALGMIADFTARRAQKIISDSEANYLQVKQRLHITDDKIALIRLGIDTNTFKFVRSNIRDTLGIPTDVPIVLFVGRLEPRKGIIPFLQSLPDIINNVPQAKIVIVGQDTNQGPGGISMREYLITEIRANGISDNLIMLDFVEIDELVQLYSTCDVLVQPSLKESFGLAVLEAMACGKPVVATCTGIAPELGLDGSNGVLVPINNVKALATGIIHCLSFTSIQRESISFQNRNKVENAFSKITWVKKWESVYNGIRKS